MNFINQYVFLIKCSTTTNLAEFYDQVFKSYDLNLQYDIMLTDFSKAFDCVLHKLLKKTEIFSINGELQEWLLNY